MQRPFTESGKTALTLTSVQCTFLQQEEDALMPKDQKDINPKFGIGW